MIIKVKKVGEDIGFCVEHYRGVDNKHYYVKRYNIDNIFIDWHTASKDWEPDCPLREGVTVRIIK